jgi:hypothetical protein
LVACARAGETRAERPRTRETEETSILVGWMIEKRASEIGRGGRDECEREKRRPATEEQALGL